MTVAALARRYERLAADVLADPALADSALAPSCPVVGTDVQAVAPVLESLAGPLREPYLARLFTSGEQTDSGADTRDGSGADTGADPHVVAESLAARFAVKEAVVKVLRPGAGVPRPAWTDIEVRRAPGGSPRLVLTGAAARLAADARLTSWSCSFAHDDGIAVATVVALHSPDPAPQTRGIAERG